MILKIAIIALISIFLSSTIKKYNNEFSNFISIAGGIIIFLLCIDELINLIDYFQELYNFIKIDYNYFSLILKIIGVGYITEFTANIAEDFGDKSIASKVVLGGKIVICGMAIPVIKSLLSLLFSFLS